ncbi:unnamed protein product [Rotaria sp. Silwood2]|nr:unnamed protein product [Rotaria sp. Silwood2]CAF4443236.1 unnamed protein product [Rotaria sp. Silwood2]
MLKENDVKEIVNDKEYIIEVDLTLENFLQIILTDKYAISLHTENIELIFHNSIEKDQEQKTCGSLAVDSINVNVPESDEGETKDTDCDILAPSSKSTTVTKRKNQRENIKKITSNHQSVCIA